MKVMPRDRWGKIPAIIFDRWSIVWSWPSAGMAWFLWSAPIYRTGPVTILRRPAERAP